MKKENLTLDQIFALYEELKNENNIILYKFDLVIEKQLRIIEFNKDGIKTIFKSKFYSQKYFDKKITKYLKDKGKKLPY